MYMGLTTFCRQTHTADPLLSVPSSIEDYLLFSHPTSIQQISEVSCTQHHQILCNFVCKKFSPFRISTCTFRVFYELALEVQPFHNSAFKYKQPLCNFHQVPTATNLKAISYTHMLLTSHWRSVRVLGQHICLIPLGSQFSGVILLLEEALWRVLLLKL